MNTTRFLGMWLVDSSHESAVASRGVTKLDGVRGKKQLWRPHVRTWGLSEANLLHWRKYLWHCWNSSAPPAVIRRPPEWFGTPMVIRRPGNCAPLVPLVMSWLRVYSRAAVKLSSVERSPATKGLKTAAFVYIFENFTVGIRNCLGDPQCSQLCSQLVKNGAYLLVPASYFLWFNDVRHFKLWWFLERSHSSTNKNSHLLASKRYPAILRDTQQFSQRRDIYKWKLFGAPIFDRPPQTPSLDPPLISKIILTRFFAIVDSQTLFTLRSGTFWKGRSRKILEIWSRKFYLRLRNPDAYNWFLHMLWLTPNSTDPTLF